MYLIQILLPLRNLKGKTFPQDQYEDVRNELTSRFGGLTAYTRSPAEGLWQTENHTPERDDIVVYEVMSKSIDRDWWLSYRRRLEHAFEQEFIVIRATNCELL